MRLILILLAASALTACATYSSQPAAPLPVQAPAISSSTLVGLTAQDLVGRFGSPALEIREGNSMKLQFRGPQCVMDTYLYPSGNSGSLRVVHVDTRLTTGADTDQAACALELRKRSM